MNDSSVTILTEPTTPAPRENVTQFHLAPGFNPEVVFRGHFDADAQRTERLTRNQYDTYVWTLWFDHLVLLSESGRLTLCQRFGEWSGPAVSEAPSPKKLPRFAWEFPPSPLRRDLERALGYRALRKIATVRIERQTWNLRDEAGKTVVRLRLEKIDKADGWQFAELTGLLGYDAELFRAAGLLMKIGPLDAARGPLGEGLRTRGLEPLPYSLKPVFRFLPSQDTRSVLQEIATRTFSVARFNEAGIIDDADTEFLHDYRVCLRKIRSVLGSLKAVFPPEQLDAWKATLGDWGRQTNRLRDLDVHLLARESMERRLPASLRAGLEPFFDELAVARASAFRRVKSFLRSEKYRQAATDLESQLLRAGSLPQTPGSLPPIGPTAAARIVKRYQRIKRLVRVLHDGTPDEEIHILRIECKKLRYLLEFFGPLFPEEHASPVQKQLSRLQNRLGRFNDTSIQQIYLLNYGNQHAANGDTRLAMSLGGVIATLHNEHVELRRSVRRSLVSFCGPKTSSRLRRFIENSTLAAE